MLSPAVDHRPRLQYCVCSRSQKWVASKSHYTIHTCAIKFLPRRQDSWKRRSRLQRRTRTHTHTHKNYCDCGPCKTIIMTTDDRSHGLVGDFRRTCKDEGAVDRKTRSAPFLVHEFNTFLFCIFYSYLLFFFKCHLDLGWNINICFPQYKTFYTQYFWLILSRKLPSILEHSRVFHSSL